MKDATGAVLPGVTVTAASPVLIEQQRTAVTDGEGRYVITQLRPGVYTVTFSLLGIRHGRTRRHSAVRRIHGERRRVSSGSAASRKRSR